MKKYFFFLALGLTMSCKKDKTIDPVCVDTVSFSATVEPIILNSCATSGCHNASSAAEGIVLETYNQIYQRRNAVLGSIKHQSGYTPMPLGADQLSSEQIQAVSCWISQGAPNN